MTKSVLHDATPSWNGFNYQGKVGIYVCLKIISNKMIEENLEGNAFDEFLNSYAIQYEWIEDFSILENDQYISHHQVKHKSSTNFSTHIEALVTILSRSQKMLSTSDLAKYLSLDSQKIDIKMSELKHLKALNEDGSLNNEWRSLDNIEQSEFYTCLDEFDQFSSNAFDKTKIYFHTSENVSPPQKDISTYKEIPVHLKSELKDKLTLQDLEDLNIFIGDKQASPFKLVLSDVQLEDELKELIDGLLSKIHDQAFTDNDQKIYLSALLRELDSHISERHLFIHKDKIDRIKKNSVLEERPKITFNSFVNILKKVFKEQDDEYWELYCRQGFELAYEKKWHELDQMIINFPENKLSYEKKQKNLESFRLHFLSKFYSLNYIGLLKKLSPHILKNKFSDDSLFYRDISNSDRIQDIFLDFIQDIEILNDEDCLSYHSINNKLYFPSAVNLAHSRKEQQDSRIKDFKQKMAKLPYKPTYFLANADFFITNTHNPEDIDDHDFCLETISELDKQDLTNLQSTKNNHSKYQMDPEPLTDTLSNLNQLKFRHYQTAIEELTDE